MFNSKFGESLNVGPSFHIRIKVSQQLSGDILGPYQQKKKIHKVQQTVVLDSNGLTHVEFLRPSRHVILWFQPLVNTRWTSSWHEVSWMMFATTRVSRNCSTHIQNIYMQKASRCNHIIQWDKCLLVAGKYLLKYVVSSTSMYIFHFAELEVHFYPQTTLIVK